MNRFNIEYHHDQISIEPVNETSNEQYRLSYHDGRWLVMGKRPDDTKTVATFNDNISYSTATVWAIEQKSEGPDWINMEQLQVIGEMIQRRAQENHSRAATDEAMV
jgi:hypothetical protein